MFYTILSHKRWITRPKPLLGIAARYPHVHLLIIVKVVECDVSGKSRKISYQENIKKEASKRSSQATEHLREMFSLANSSTIRVTKYWPQIELKCYLLHFKNIDDFEALVKLET